MKILICSDLHIRESSPRCRKDDYWSRQKAKLEFIKNLSRECNITICAGDVFHHWKPSPFLIRESMKRLPVGMLCIPGQHDLPQHDFSQIGKSGFAVLEQAGIIEKLYVNEPFTRHLIYPDKKSSNDIPIMIDLYPFGRSTEENIAKAMEAMKDDDGIFKIAVIHELVWESKKKDTRQDFLPLSGHVKRVAKRLEKYNLIVCGDNHNYFVVKERQTSKFIINTGSMMRMTISQAEDEPSVVVFDTANKSYRRVYLPISSNLKDTFDFESKMIEDGDEKLSLFIEQLCKEYEIGLNFRKNIEEFLAKNPNIRNEVRQMIWRIVENE